MIPAAAEAQVVEMLRSRGRTLALAESCTGGLAAARLTAIAGASDCFWGSAVVYQRSAKIEMAGLDAEQLARDGLVSAATTARLARAIRARARSDLGAAVTGWAGPTSSGPDPVGTVYVAVATGADLIEKRNVYDGDRNAVRHAACETLFELLLLSLEGLAEERGRRP